MSVFLQLPIINLNDVDETEFRYEGEASGGRGVSRDPSKILGMQHFGVSLHTLHPGQENARYHAERDEEEFFFVQTGSCKVRLDGKIYVLNAGDILHTPVGCAHSFFNDAEDPCTILMAGQTVRGTQADYLPAPDGPVETSRPPRCLNVAEIFPEPVQYDGEVQGSRGESVEVSAALGMKSLFCNIHRLMPGQQDAKFHFHKQEEEFFMILKGTPVLCFKDDAQVTQPDDCIYIAPNTPHNFSNRSDKPAIIFMMNTVCGHPDSFYLPEKRVTRLV
ncbi:MAG: cupin domain-containing protein [Candidatus Sericytochromatia bacterium]|nr:cupin domain-containing protein [Candidatus Sericytochromatia bacterium]